MSSYKHKKFDENTTTIPLEAWNYEKGIENVKGSFQNPRNIFFSTKYGMYEPNCGLDIFRGNNLDLLRRG